MVLCSVQFSNYIQCTMYTVYTMEDYFILPNINYKSLTVFNKQFQLQVLSLHKDQHFMWQEVL